jgi:uncharacterized protein
MRVDLRVAPVSEAQQTVISFFQALGDTQRLIDVFEEQATWTVWGDFPFSGTHSGRDAVVYGFHADAAKLFADDETAVLTVKALIGEGPVVAAEFEYQTPTAIGKRYHNHYVEVFEVRSGKILHVREYMDTSHLQQACLRAGAETP